MMKKIFLRIIIIFSCIIINSCENENFKGCENTSFIGELSKKEVVIFQDSIPNNTTTNSYIIYNKQTNIATWYIEEEASTIRIQMRICNFPEKAKKWTNFTNAIISGNKYKSSTQDAHPANYMYYDFSITKLERGGI